MLMQAIARETFMNYEFNYENDTELPTILMELRSLQRSELCKAIDVIPGQYRDIYKGAVFACIRCDAVETLIHRLRTHFIVQQEVHTVQDDYISIDTPF